MKKQRKKVWGTLLAVTLFAISVGSVFAPLEVNATNVEQIEEATIEDKQQATKVVPEKEISEKLTRENETQREELLDSTLDEKEQEEISVV